MAGVDTRGADTEPIRRTTSSATPGLRRQPRKRTECAPRRWLERFVRPLVELNKNMSDYDDRREQRREEQRRYESDVFYEVWRSGGNTDRINPDRVQDRYWNGQDSESAARAELNAQRPKPQEPSEEEYYEEMQRQQAMDEQPPGEVA